MLPEASSPYKGLVPYAEEDAQFFFGREAEREIITANLIASRLTVLYGESGVGKSSVLRAGVAHHLHMVMKQNLSEQSTPEFIVVVFNSWRDDPIASLIARMKDSLMKAFDGQSIEMIEPGSSLVETLQVWTQHFDCDFLIILDQFEEYFLYHPQEDRSGFDREFPHAVNRPDLRTNFLVSIREDSLAKLDRFKGRIPSLFNNYLRLEYLDLDAAHDAIVQPVEQYNLLHPEATPISVDPALIDGVLAQVKRGELIVGGVGRGVAKESNAKAQIETPYLQLVMTRIWDEERFQNSCVLRLETLNQLGGANAIVSTHLDRVMGYLKKADQTTAAVFFLYLVTPSGSKIAYPVSDLIAYSERSKAEVEPILNMLERERVLRYIPSSVDQTATGRYEIYHDVLARSILDWRSRFLQSQTITKNVKRTVIRGGLIFIIAIIAVILLTYRFTIEALSKTQARDQSAMIVVPPGSINFQFGDAVQSIHVPEFSIERQAVTNRAYGLCVKVNKCTHPIGSADFNDPQKQDDPVVWLTVVQAATYCEWIGYRLPTATEWERAAMHFGPNLPNGVQFLLSDVWEWTSSYTEGSQATISAWSGQSESLMVEWIFLQEGAFLDLSNELEIITNISGAFGASGDLGFRCASE